MLKNHINKKTTLAIIFGSLIIIILIFYINISTNASISSKEDVYQNEKTVDANSSSINLQKELNLLKGYKKDTSLLLCNKSTLLPTEYEPNDIVESNLPFLSYITTTKLNSITATNAKDMFNAAKENNINLLGASGYRSYAVQKNLFQEKVNSVGFEKASEYSAPPRASEHETGYALDIVSKESPILQTNFENSTASKWLNENAHDYGFILRYPKDKENITGYKYEPWHFRYVGVEHAKYIKENNLTLEEYLSLINEKISFLELSLKED